MKTKQLTLIALFICLGIMLPFLTASNPQLGQIFLLIHIPVLIGGIVLGPKSGFLIGISIPLLRSLLFTMPPLYPTALAMSVEMATYGYVFGLAYQIFHRHKLSVFISLILSMLVGRILWGLTSLVLLGWGNFSFSMFISAGFVQSWPGIILQLILIPFIINTTKPIWKKLNYN